MKHIRSQVGPYCTLSNLCVQSCLGLRAVSSVMKCRLVWRLEREGRHSR